METWDDDEEDRLEHLLLAKQRGKGAPKKKRTADGESPLFALSGGDTGRYTDTWSSESKRFKGKKRPAPAATAPSGVKS